MMEKAGSWPNILSFLRLLSAPLLGFFICQGHLQEALWVFLFASLTDILDGLWARLSGDMSRLGLYLDPIADKVLLLVAYGCLGLKGYLPLWLIFFVIVRDLLIVRGAWILHREGQDSQIQPLMWGKLNTLTQISLILITLSAYLNLFPGIFTVWVFFIFLTVVLGMISLGVYMAMYLKIRRSKHL